MKIRGAPINSPNRWPCINCWIIKTGPSATDDVVISDKLQAFSSATETEQWRHDLLQWRNNGTVRYSSYLERTPGKSGLRLLITDTWCLPERTCLTLSWHPPPTHSACHVVIARSRLTDHLCQHDRVSYSYNVPPGYFPLNGRYMFNDSNVQNVGLQLKRLTTAVNAAKMWSQKDKLCTAGV